MNNPKINTQKTLSAVIAAALAFVTLFQAVAANSSEAAEFVSAEEATLLAEFDQYFADEAMEVELEVELEEVIFLEEIEEATEEVKIFDQNNELIGEGNPDTNPLLAKLVNQADFLSNMGGQQYYRVAQ